MTTVGGDQFLQYTLMSKNVLSLEEQELYELSQLAGVVLDPSVFKSVPNILTLSTYRFYKLFKVMLDPSVFKSVPKNVTQSCLCLVYHY